MVEQVDKNSSLELINELGGIQAARDTLVEIEGFDWDSFESVVLVKWTSARKRLEQAISEYESTCGVYDDN